MFPWPGPAGLVHGQERAGGGALPSPQRRAARLAVPPRLAPRLRLRPLQPLPVERPQRVLPAPGLEGGECEHLLMAVWLIEEISPLFSITFHSNFALNTFSKLEFFFIFLFKTFHFLSPEFRRTNIAGIFYFLLIVLKLFDLEAAIKKSSLFIAVRLSVRHAYNAYGRPILPNFDMQLYLGSN